MPKKALPRIRMPVFPEPERMRTPSQPPFMAKAIRLAAPLCVPPMRVLPAPPVDPNSMPCHSLPRADTPSLSTGDSVRHETLGEGVVTAVEAGGVVTVRFADDGTERRLMLDYAPLEKLAQ